MTAIQVAMPAADTSKSGMSSVNFQRFDLNLIKVFLAIWDLQSVTAASERLGLTQPAISHGLRRLREHFDDPLFTRVGHTMVPTHAATQLYVSFDHARQSIEQSIQAHDHFDPAISQRVFRIAMSDMSEYYFIPTLLGRIESIAPHIRIDTITLDRETTESALRAGQIDMALGYTPEFSNECLSTLLFRDTFICLVRDRHPFKGKALTEAEFAALDYIDVSTEAPGYHMIDQRLILIGPERKRKARLVHLTVAPEVLRQTDLAALYPRSVAMRINGNNDFRLIALPFDLPEVPITLSTHRNFQGDAAILWLGQEICALNRL